MTEVTEQEMTGCVRRWQMSKVSTTESVGTGLKFQQSGHCKTASLELRSGGEKRRSHTHN